MKQFKLLLTVFAVFSITFSYSQGLTGYDTLSLVQKKAYDYFMTDKWTFKAMNKLKGKELGTVLLSFLDKKEAGEAYRFYTRLKQEKHTQELNQRLIDDLGHD